MIMSSLQQQGMSLRALMHLTYPAGRGADTPPPLHSYPQPIKAIVHMGAQHVVVLQHHLWKVLVHGLHEIPAAIREDACQQGACMRTQIVKRCQTCGRCQYIMYLYNITEQAYIPIFCTGAIMSH